MDLLNLLEVDVLDHEHPDEPETHNAQSSSKHSDLSVRVRLLNGDSRSRSDGVAELDIDTVVDVVDVGQGRLGEVALQSRLEGIGPDRGGDGDTGRVANSAHNVQHSKCSSNVLMVDSSQDSELLDNNEDRTANGDEDLTHDLIAHALVWTTEVDHQTLGKDIQRYGDVQKPSEVASAANDPTDTEEKDTRNNVEDIDDVTGGGNAQVIDNLQEVLEVHTPTVVGELIGSIQKTGTDDGTVSEEGEVHHGLRRKVSLPNSEEEEHGESDHNHSDNVTSSPAIRSFSCDIERQFKQDETGSEHEDTDDYWMAKSGLLIPNGIRQEKAPENILSNSINQ